jgi:cell division protein FtsB
MLKTLRSFQWPTLVLLALVVAIQWPLWFGKGGWMKVHQLDGSLKEQQVVNGKLGARNQALAGEVADLKTGLAAIEERARNELDLIQGDEIFVSIVGKTAATQAANTPSVGNSSLNKSQP